MVSRIRLAWWRESLERLDAAAPPPEPVLQALGNFVLPRGVRGSELAEMEEGWAELLADGPLDGAALGAFADKRGGRLFHLSARLLGGDQALAEQAGARWALVDFARRSSNPAEARAAFDLARSTEGGPALGGKLMPLGMLDLLRKRDMSLGPDNWERQGSPARMVKMMAFRLIGG